MQPYIKSNLKYLNREEGVQKMINAVFLGMISGICFVSTVIGACLIIVLIVTMLDDRNKMLNGQKKDDTRYLDILKRRRRITLIAGLTCLLFGISGEAFSVIGIDKLTNGAAMVKTMYLGEILPQEDGTYESRNDFTGNTDYRLLTGEGELLPKTVSNESLRTFDCGEHVPYLEEITETRTWLCFINEEISYRAYIHVKGEDAE